MFITCLFQKTATRKPSKLRTPNLDATLLDGEASGSPSTPQKASNDVSLLLSKLPQCRDTVSSRQERLSCSIVFFCCKERLSIKEEWGKQHLDTKSFC